ncbi:IS1595 family transposase [Acidiphilium acidophilum]|uniref:IS1595 family transposase n=1 Tax=Acidiphilium acidophilum TaxID=76588 RepID=A0AAW9DMZ0_ACIAO|nr:IS1595 family transposase [Acidiphilium acidophilum]MDX5929808.1 IS1595 family transposase [Acidiphilium acidophilum]MDX5930788.1 IS1595 family transposase [Acidiphilium acidophilum]
MARNAVQLQKGLSEAEFDRLYGTEEQCRAVVIKLRWRDGFSCPICGGTTYSEVKTRDLFQCSTCRRQTSPIAGTIFASTKLPLRTWFRAMYHLTQSKQGISSIELGRRLGVRQTTAWMLKHKIQQAMMERDGRKRLKGRVEIDDAVLGGERSGGKRGRGAPGKTPFVAAVETTDDGKPARLKLRRVAGFTGQAISRFALNSLDPSCTVVSDGLACFHRVTDAGCQHQPTLTGSGPAAVRNPAFKWVNTALGNIKSAINGTYRAISTKHVPRYLAEFEYRFNRRYDLASMIPRLGYAIVTAPPMPYRLLKLAETYG